MVQNNTSARELPEKLQEVANLLHTQDNRITDQPMFIVQEKVRDYGYEPEYEEGYSWYDELNEHEEVTSKAAVYLLENMNGGTSPYVRIGYRERWEYVTACFTEQGCKDYISINKHNHNGELRIYANGSFRNNEYRAIRNFLMESHNA